MRTGIIGSAAMGRILAGKLADAGHSVKVANSRGPESLADFAAQTGATAVSVLDVVKDVDVVFVAIPTKAVADLPTGLFDGVPDDVVVVDITNTFPWRDGLIQAFEKGVPESRWVSERIGRSVVKAFNTVGFPTLYSEGRPAGSDGRIAIPVAGDDAKAKDVVLGLVDQFGFDGVDAEASRIPGGSSRGRPPTAPTWTSKACEKASPALMSSTRGNGVTSPRRYSPVQEKTCPQSLTRRIWSPSSGPSTGPSTR
jgi:8-hydroxy-5-deazaflavin:NADPH oxidoreductase